LFSLPLFTALRLHQKKLASALIHHGLAHQHSKVRQSSLKALGSLVCCGGEGLDKLLKESILQALKNCLFDGQPSVRKQLVLTLSSILELSAVSFVERVKTLEAGTKDVGMDGLPVANSQELRLSLENEAQLLMILLSGISDDVAECSELSFKEVERLASSVWEAEEASRIVMDKLESQPSSPTQAEAGGMAEQDSSVPMSTEDSTIDIEKEKKELEVWDAKGEKQTNIFVTDDAPMDTSNAVLQGLSADEYTMEWFQESLEVLPFNQRPHPVARQKMQHMCAMILRHLVPQLQDWNQSKRVKSIQLLGVLAGYTECSLGVHLEKFQVLKALSSSVKDSDDKVVEALNQVGVVLGSNVGSSILLALLVPLIYHESQAHAQTAAGVSGSLLLLTSIIEGMPKEGGATYRGQTLDTLIDILDKDHIREAEGTQIQYQLLELNLTLVEQFHPDLSRRVLTPQGGVEGAAADVKYMAPVLRNLIQLMSADDRAAEDGGENDENAVDMAKGGVEALAEAANMSTDDLYRELLPHMLGRMWDGNTGKKVWEKHSPRHLFFESLVRYVGPSLHHSVGTVVDVFAMHLELKNNAPEMRLAMLVLMQTFLDSGLALPSLQKSSVKIMKECLIPNMVWSAGKVASTVRKVGVACLYTMLRQNIAHQKCLFATGSEVLPLLKTSLDDYDGSTRQMTCLAMDYMFKALPGALSNEVVVQLYGDLLKRFDDSDDKVRLAACGTFSSFLKTSAPANFEGTVIDYSLDVLFIHLDDSDPAVQEAVFGTLKVAATVNEKCVKKKAGAARDRHRNPQYCDQLLAM
jgi:hypothetical protein